MAVFPCFLWSGVNGLSELLSKTEIEDGLHASLAETSLMLALKPELVGDERPNDGNKVEIPEGWSLEGNAPTAWLTDDFSKSGVIGDSSCLLYTSDAADDLTRVDLGGRRIIKKTSNSIYWFFSRTQGFFWDNFTFIKSNNLNN